MRSPLPRDQSHASTPLLSGECLEMSAHAVVTLPTGKLCRAAKHPSVKVHLLSLLNDALLVLQKDIGNSKAHFYTSVPVLVEIGRIGCF